MNKLEITLLILLILSVITNIFLSFSVKYQVEVSDNYCQLSNTLKEYVNEQTEIVVDFGNKLNYDLSELPTDKLEYNKCPLTDYKEVDNYE